jgi:Rrf2 family cysteine metabolism transcriptional repressor
MLKVSLKTEYALRALMELAARRGEGHVPARTIASTQGIPLKFLEHQLAVLHKAGIVASTRGANGGCSLARDPSEIRIGDVIELFEGPVAVMSCLDEQHDERCAQTHQCGLQELWMRVDNAVRDVLHATTLADITTRHHELQPLLWPTLMTRALPEN